MILKEVILVNTGEGKKHVLPEEIFFVKAERKKTEINLNDGRAMLTNHNLRWFEDHLPGEYFIRIHKSYIINLSNVNAFTADTIILNHKQIIPVGRRYRKVIKLKLTVTSMDC